MLSHRCLCIPLVKCGDSTEFSCSLIESERDTREMAASKLFVGCLRRDCNLESYFASTDAYKSFLRLAGINEAGVMRIDKKKELLRNLVKISEIPELVKNNFQLIRFVDIYKMHVAGMMSPPELIRIHGLKQGDWVLFEGVKKPSTYYNTFYKIVSVTRLESMFTHMGDHKDAVLTTSANLHTTISTQSSTSLPLDSKTNSSVPTFSSVKRLAETDLVDYNNKRSEPRVTNDGASSPRKVIDVSFCKRLKLTQPPTVLSSSQSPPSCST